MTKTRDATGQLDSDDGHGIINMNQIAKKAGIGVIGVKNSSHCGAIGLYTNKIIEEGMIGIAFTHSGSFVIPYKGNKAFLGIKSAKSAGYICYAITTPLGEEFLLESDICF